MTLRLFTSGKRKGLVNTLTMLLIWLWGFVILVPVALQYYRGMTDPEQWMLVHLSFDTTNDSDGWPFIIFDREIMKPTGVLSFGWVEERTVDDSLGRVCGGQNDHYYVPEDTGRFRMRAGYFLGADCPLPSAPFRICKRWILTDDYGLRSHVGPACTGIYKEIQDERNL